MHDLKMAVGTFLASLASQPLVVALMGGNVSLSRDLVVSALVSAAVAVIHKFHPHD